MTEQAEQQTPDDDGTEYETFLVYAPEGIEKQRWPFALDALKVGEVKLIEKIHDETVMEFFDTIQRGSYTRLVTLFWIIQRRDDKTVQLVDFDDLGLSEIYMDRVPVEVPKDETPAGSDPLSVSPQPSTEPPPSSEPFTG